MTVRGKILRFSGVSPLFSKNAFDKKKETHEVYRSLN